MCRDGSRVKQYQYCILVVNCMAYTHLIPYCVSDVSNTGLNEMPVEIESHGKILIVTVICYLTQF